jgi:hypothetical protein
MLIYNWEDSAYQKRHYLNLDDSNGVFIITVSVCTGRVSKYYADGKYKFTSNLTCILELENNHSITEKFATILITGLII